MTTASENPYASPIMESELTNRRIAMRRLRPVAICLLVVALLMLIFLSLGWVSAGILYVLDQPAMIEFQMTLWGELWYAFAAIILANAFVFYASIQMLRVRQYPACVIGAFIAVIPVLSSFYVLGIPFAIWALIVLFRQDTRVAFKEAT